MLLLLVGLKQVCNRLLVGGPVVGCLSPSRICCLICCLRPIDQIECHFISHVFPLSLSLFFIFISIYLSLLPFLSRVFIRFAFSLFVLFIQSLHDAEIDFHSPVLISVCEVGAFFSHSPFIHASLSLSLNLVFALMIFPFFFSRFLYLPLSSLFLSSH